MNTPPDNTEPKPAKPGSVVSVVALANRFLAQKAAPGWHDLKLLAEVLMEEADGAVKAYQGKDRDELFDLNLRAQMVHAAFAEFFGRIEAAIENAKGLPGFQMETGKEPVVTDRIAGSY